MSHSQSYQQKYHGGKYNSGRPHPRGERSDPRPPHSNSRFTAEDGQAEGRNREVAVKTNMYHVWNRLYLAFSPDGSCPAVLRLLAENGIHLQDLGVALGDSCGVFVRQTDTDGCFLEIKSRGRTAPEAFHKGDALVRFLSWILLSPEFPYRTESWAPPAPLMYSQFPAVQYSSYVPQVPMPVFAYVPQMPNYSGVGSQAMYGEATGEFQSELFVSDQALAAQVKSVEQTVAVEKTAEELQPRYGESLVSSLLDEVPITQKDEEPYRPPSRSRLIPLFSSAKSSSAQKKETGSLSHWE